MDIETVDRRAVLALGALLAAGSTAPALAADKAAANPARGGDLPPDAPKVAMLVYPRMVPLDLIGPLTIFNLAGFDVRLVWKDKAPVMASGGLSIAATETFDECPADLDVLFVPGGIAGTVACMNDPAVLGFLADRGARAKWVTGVCTGTLVLAAAGLLKGYDATSHWAVADMLPLMGARQVDKRVVRDRNRMTGGGVTAGIDFGLTLVAEMKGEEVARTAQLTIEYAPAPPFANGTPAEAGPDRAAAMRQSRKPIDDQARAAAERIGKGLGITG
jgi:cyclohexyl-isocyanide hydratase